jgi:hypothetical protein
VKLSTVRSAERQFRFVLFSTAALVAFTPIVLRADTIKTFGVPGADDAGKGHVDAADTFTSRASTLTTELLDLLSAHRLLSARPGGSDEFFTFDGAERGRSRSASSDTLTDLMQSGRMVSPVYSTWATSGSTWATSESTGGTSGSRWGTRVSTWATREPIGWNRTNLGRHDDPPGDGTRTPFLNGPAEPGLSIGGSAEIAKLENAMLLPANPAGEVVADATVPEPGGDYLILLAGIMTAVILPRFRTA